jgi:hypothetical protein
MILSGSPESIGMMSFGATNGGLRTVGGGRLDRVDVMMEEGISAEENVVIVGVVSVSFKIARSC